MPAPSCVQQVFVFGRGLPNYKTPILIQWRLQNLELVVLEAGSMFQFHTTWVALRGDCTSTVACVCVRTKEMCVFFAHEVHTKEMCVFFAHEVNVIKTDVRSRRCPPRRRNSTCRNMEILNILLIHYARTFVRAASVCI